MRILLLFENDGLPSGFCQFICCVPWIEKYKHDPGAEREDAESILVVFRNKLCMQKPEYTEVKESCLQSLTFLIFLHK